MKYLPGGNYNKLMTLLDCRCFICIQSRNLTRQTTKIHLVRMRLEAMPQHSSAQHWQQSQVSVSNVEEFEENKIMTN